MTATEALNTDPPANIKLHHYDGDTAEISFQSITRSPLKKMLMVPAVIVWFLGVLVFLFALSDGNFLFAGLLLIFNIGLPKLFFSVFPQTVDIIINMEEILIRGEKFDRRFWGGFSLHKGDKDTPNRLDFSYRGKIESTGYEISKAVSSLTKYEKPSTPEDAVIWMNELVADTGVSIDKSPSASVGIRPQQF